MEKEKNDNSNKVEGKKNTKRKNKTNRKARGQNGKHNSTGVVRSRPFNFRTPSLATSFLDNPRSRVMKVSFEPSILTHGSVAQAADSRSTIKMICRHYTISHFYLAIILPCL